MKIIFDSEDRISAYKALRALGFDSWDDQKIESILHNVEAAFQQQLEDELNHMAEEFET